MARKGWRYTFYILVFSWVAVLLISLSGLLRISGAIGLGSIIDIVLLYVSAVLIYTDLCCLISTGYHTATRCYDEKSSSPRTLKAYLLQYIA